MELKPKFYLKDPSPTDKVTAIYVSVQIQRTRFRYGIGKSIYPPLWDQETQRPTENGYLIKKWKERDPEIKTDLKNIFNRISNVRHYLNQYVSRKELANDNVDLNELKEYLDREIKEVKKVSSDPSRINLKDFIDQYIRELERGERKIPGTQKRYAPSTIKVDKEWRTQFEKYQMDNKVKLDFDDITSKFFQSYTQYFSDKNYKTNSIWKQVKVLKKIMRAAEKLKLHQNLAYQDFSIQQEESKAIYLTKKELKKLYDQKLKQKHHKEARDVFFCGCYSGLRYSDYSRLKPEHFKQDDQGRMFLEMITSKTGTRVRIPVLPELKTILKKYKYQLPKSYQQKLNVYIKEIAREAKINELIEIQTIEKGFTVKKSVPKHQLISTHTARRTAITNWYLDGIPPVDIMKISGHKTERNLLKYIKVGINETAERIYEKLKLRKSPLKKIT